nr:Serine/threonine-protein kinase samkB [Ipomoea batatas]
MVVEDSKIWGSGNAVKEPKGNHLKCSNIGNDDFTFIMNTTFAQQNEVVDTSENTEVNVTERVNLDRIRYGLVEAAGCQDTTESSSSFEESISGVDESDLCGDVTSAVAFGEVGDLLSMRGKKVTSHWSSFIKPIEWRCKWVELQLWKLKSLAQKYDKELAQYSDKKQFAFKNFGSEDTNSKSIPFPFTQQRNKVLERKRRRRNEDKLDIAQYMSKHNLFSFYENRTSATDGAFRNDDRFSQVGNPDSRGSRNVGPNVMALKIPRVQLCPFALPCFSMVSTEKLKSGNELKIDEELVQLMHMDGNNSMEQILRKIDGLQSQVSGLKARLGKVMRENPVKFTCADNPGLDVPSNALTKSRNLTALSTGNEDRMIEGSPIASQLLAEYSKDGEMIERSHIPIATQLLAEYSKDSVIPCKDGVTASTDQSLVVGTRVNNEDVFMIYDSRMKERMRSFQEVEIPPEGKVRVIEGGQGQRRAIPPALMEPFDDQSARGLLSITDKTGRGRSISSARSERS